MRFVGVDHSTTHLGVASLPWEDSQGEPTAQVLELPQPPDGHPDANLWRARHLPHVVSGIRWPDDMVICSIEYTFSRNRLSIEGYSVVLAVVVAALPADVTLNRLTAAQWKSSLVGRLPATKDDVVNSALERGYDLTPLGQDAWDALGIAFASREDSRRLAMEPA